MAGGTFNGGPDWRSGAIDFKALFAYGLSADKRSNGYGSFIGGSAEPHCDDIRRGELVMGSANTRGDPSMRPRVFSNSAGLDAKLPMGMSNFPDLAELRILYGLRYYGTAVGEHDSSVADRSTEGLVVSSGGTDTIEQLGVPGSTSVGQKLRVGLPVATLGMADYTFKPPRGMPPGKRPFVAKVMDPRNFAARMASLPIAYAKNPQQFNRIMATDGGDPLTAVAAATHEHAIQCGLQFLYHALLSDDIPLADDAPAAETLVLQLARKYGHLGGEGAQPDARRAFLRRVFHDPHDLPYQFAARRDAPVEAIPVDASGRLIRSSDAGKFYTRQLNSFTTAIAAQWTLFELERELYIGKVIAPNAHGRLQRIVKGVF